MDILQATPATELRIAASTGFPVVPLSGYESPPSVCACAFIM